MSAATSRLNRLGGLICFGVDFFAGFGGIQYLFDVFPKFVVVFEQFVIL